MNIEEKMMPIDEWNKQFSCKYIQQPISFLTEENLDRLQQHCEKAIQYGSGRILEEHQVTLELIIRYNELKTELEKEKEKNKKLEYIIASNTTREIISNLKNSKKSREDLEMLDLGWKEELKEKFQNTRNEILSQTLIKVTDRYWMDKCLEYINNLEKELIGEE